MMGGLTVLLFIFNFPALSSCLRVASIHGVGISPLSYCSQNGSRLPQLVSRSAFVSAFQCQPVVRPPVRGQMYAMFTGIVEVVGKVLSVDRKAQVTLWDGRQALDGFRLRVSSPVAVQECYKGCSVAVDGVCLTVTHFSDSESFFDADISPETIRRSNLGSLAKGSLVNIERAAKIGQARNSGHQVQGHIDGRGKIVQRFMDGTSIVLTIQYPDQPSTENGYQEGMIVQKGFVAIDGISLTITDVNKEKQTFSVMLVPHTQQHVALGAKGVGDAVNIEIDIMGKYVAAMVSKLGMANKSSNASSSS
eukprot:GHVS01063209.1.p1 GENE.GHVS01063209.1~~GHVS01063209.1.p1  ORF type:complete len:306 (-),score=34.17 GHVS01063209.1:465-1382(-)